MSCFQHICSSRIPHTTKWYKNKHAVTMREHHISTSCTTFIYIYTGGVQRGAPRHVLFCFWLPASETAAAVRVVHAVSTNHAAPCFVDRSKFQQPTENNTNDAGKKYVFGQRTQRGSECVLSWLEPQRHIKTCQEELWHACSQAASPGQAALPARDNELSRVQKCQKTTQMMGSLLHVASVR